MGSGQPAAPKDNSAEVARIEAQAAAEARAAEEAQKEKEREQFNTRLGSAFDNALLSASDYFTSQGLDPNDYTSQIQTRANALRGTVPDLDLSPGTYFEGLGQTVYNSEQDAMRNRYGRTLDDLLPTGFAADRIDNTADDATLAAILEEQQADARGYVDNLLNRGVITSTGYDAAIDEILGQRAGATARLDEIGQGELERGRVNLRDIANTGRSTIDNLRLGSTFDPYGVSSDVDAAALDFFDNLGTTLRGVAPTDLFSTDGLSAIAGAAQGAGNTAFDPAAVAGLGTSNDDDDDDDEEDNNAVTF